MKILVIEDDRDQRMLIREALIQHFKQDTVECIESGRQALQMNLNAFDIILTDFNLPDINGEEFLKTISGRCEKPIIVVTGENGRQTVATAIRSGACDYIVKTGDYLYTIPLLVEKNLEAYKLRQENKKLIEQQQQTTREIALKNQQLSETLQKMEQMASTDPLTGLHNRRYFNETLERCFAEAMRYEKDLSCIMCDLDGYKKLNDTMGHQFGDKMLQVTAKIINWNLRVMDIAARYGGDEFVILLPQCAAELAATVGERIQTQFITQMKTIVPNHLTLTMSQGIAAMVRNKPTNHDQLVAMADAALYSAKKQGKNRTIISNALKGVEATQAKEPVQLPKTGHFCPVAGAVCPKSLK